MYFNFQLPTFLLLTQFTITKYVRIKQIKHKANKNVMAASNKHNTYANDKHVLKNQNTN